MRRVLRIGNDGTVGSALGQMSEPLDLQVGMSVVFTRDVEIAPYGTIGKGCRCWVSWVDEISGRTEINPEGDEPALLWWNNRIILEPFDTDEITEALVVERRSVPPVPPSRSLRRCLAPGRVAALVLLAFAVGWLLPNPPVLAEGLTAAIEQLVH